MSAGARLCPTCKKTYPVGTSHCPADGTALVSADYARLVGQIIDGRYRIIRALGFGGMGCVYYAEHTRLNKAFALKFLLKELTQNSEMSQRFQQEANSMSKLEHPNCVSVFDFGNTSDGLLYLAMEFLEGQDLGKVIQREDRLPVRRAVRIARQVAECLAEAHRMSIIHRDLKPENIMLVRRGEEHDFVKVLDFGLAKILDSGFDDSPRQALTAVGMVHGTPPYMSPEQANGDELDGRSDVYSLGVILFQMVTGKLPFTGKSAVEIMLAHVTQPPPSPRSLRPDLSASIEALILRSLEKDREKRFADAREMARALLAAEDATEALSQSSLAAAFVAARRSSSQSIPAYPSQRQAAVMPPSVDRPTPTRLMTTSPVPRQTPGSVHTTQPRQVAAAASSSEEYGLGSAEEMATIMDRRIVQSPMDIVKNKPMNTSGDPLAPSIQKPAALTYEATEAQIPIPEFPQDKTTTIPLPPQTALYRKPILLGTIAASVGLILALLYFLFLQP